MTDISQLFKSATSKNVPWSTNLFYQALESLKSFGYSISFWEGEENWATVLVNNVVVAYVWRRFPLAFVNTVHFDEVKKALYAYDFLTFIGARYFSEKNLIISDPELKGFIDYGVDLDSFSVDDLWFYTNSN